MNNNIDDDVYIISKKERMLEKENKLLERLKNYKKNLDIERENNIYEIRNAILRKNNILKSDSSVSNGKKREHELKTLLESKNKKKKKARNC